MKNLFLIILSLIASQVYAQLDNTEEEKWMKIIENSTSVTKSQKNKIRNISNKKIAKEVYPIKLKKIHKHQKNNILKIKLPNFSSQFSVRATHIDAKSEDDFKWIGRFEDGGGNIILISEEGKIRGHIRYKDATYEIHHIDKEIHALVEINNDNEDTCANPDSIEQHSEEKKEIKSNNRIVACVQHQVDILILATNNALAADPNITQTANLAIQQYNDALNNSDIFISKPRLNLVGAVTVVLGFNETLDINADVSRLTTNGSANYLREYYDADIVVMLTDGNYGNIAGIVAAIGPNDNNAYSIVQVNNATSTYTFSHEIGHLFGCLHQACTITNAPGCTTSGLAYEQGYRFSQGGNTYRTIMHQIAGGGTRIQHFSNPDVTFNGVSTGVNTFADNARKLENTASTLADFRIRGSLFASIDGPTSVPLYTVQSWEVAIQDCAVGPYNVQWYYSTNGFTYYTAGTSHVYTLTPVTDSQFYLRCKVTSSDGKQYTTTRSVYAYGSRVTDSLKTEKEELITSDFDNINGIDISPNPVENFISITFTTREIEEVKIEVSNLLGKSVLTENKSLERTGIHKIELERNNLPKGIYLVNLQMGKSRFVKKILLK